MELAEFWLRIFDIFTGAAFVLIGVLGGWFLATRTQKKMLKTSEIRNELEKAYGTLYSIVSRPEEMVKMDGGQERRVVVPEEEKRELDRILMSSPHMFPYEIVVLWRTQIRDLQPFRLSPEFEETTFITYREWFGIPLKFKDEIIKEYERRLQEYYKIVGRWKSVKDLPKVARV